MSSEKTADKNSSQKLYHFRYLDALRGIAVLGVIFVHASFITGQNGFSSDLGFTGQRGVQLFYVISAFTIFYSLDTRIKNERYPILNFYIRRFFRIAPLYYIAIIINLFIHGLSPWVEAPKGTHVYDIILGFLFLNGFKPSIINAIALGGWSIAVETTFYAFAPLLHKYINNIFRAFYLLVIAAPLLFFTSVYLNNHVAEEYHQYICFLSFPVEFPVFCIGILTYFIWNKYIFHHSINDNVTSFRKEISLVLLLFSFVFAASNFPFSYQNLYLTSFSFLPFILAMSLYEWSLLVNSVTVFIGKISYSMYLMSGIIFLGVEYFLNNIAPGFSTLHSGSHYFFIAMFLVLTVLDVGLSTITYYTIEKPGMNLGKKLIRYIEASGGLSAALKFKRSAKKETTIT